MSEQKDGKELNVFEKAFVGATSAFAGIATYSVADKVLGVAVDALLSSNPALKGLSWIIKGSKLILSASTAAVCADNVDDYVKQAMELLKKAEPPKGSTETDENGKEIVDGDYVEVK